MKILITGCAGFIGSHLVDACLERGHDVIGLDNLSLPYGNWIDPEWSKHSFEFIKGDIENLDTCLEACSNAEIVLHQAALGSVPKSLKFPNRYFKTNVIGFHNMLEASRLTKVKRFIYASSSSTHGDSGFLKAPYALSKYSNEIYATHYAAYFGIQTIGLRYFNVFGPRQNKDGCYAAVIPKWVEKIKDGVPVEIFGDGKQSRDFTYIKNVVLANLRAIETDFPYAGVYDIGCGETWTLLQLYQYMLNIIAPDKQPLVVYSNARAGDITFSKADITKAKKDLGYNPTWNLPAGLEDCFA